TGSGRGQAGAERPSRWISSTTRATPSGWNLLPKTPLPASAPSRRRRPPTSSAWSPPTRKKARDSPPPSAEPTTPSPEWANFPAPWTGDSSTATAEHAAPPPRMAEKTLEFESPHFLHGLFADDL